MKEKINTFLESDLLEKYLVGATSIEESLQVERYIALYPQVREVFDELQENLEAFANLYAVKAPEDLKSNILQTIKTEKQTKSNFFRFGIAASVTALLFAVASIFFYTQNRDLKEKNDLVNNRIKNLELDMRVQLEDLRNQYIVLNNPNTKTYKVRGTKRAKELTAVAYINPVKKLSYVNVKHLPQLPEDQCYQMWAEVNGELINLGVIGKKHSDKEALLPLPYADNALSYITIEPKGGNNAPTVKNIAANIPYKRR